MKKKFGILIALVMALSLCLVPAAPAMVAETLAEGTTYEIVGNYYPVDFTVTDDGPTVTWTFDMIGGKALVGDGHWGYGLAISLDGLEPAFQIHNNDGSDSTYAWGTHLYSPYDDGWVSGTTNTLVSELSWVTCTGKRDITDNPSGVFTVTIDKAELGPEFYWAIWFGVGGFWSPNTGYSSYPEDFIWGENVATDHYEPCSVSVNNPPVADPNGPYLGVVYTPISFDGTVSSDPDDDPLTYDWDWGDDSSAGSGATPSHTYTEVGIYNVCLTVNDGSLDSAEVCTIAVVYDPSAGFVTGGGWIDSPPGAYMPGPTNIAGTFAGDFTSRFTNIECDPNNTPVTFTGSVEVTGIQPNGAVMIGLVDQGLYDSGDSAWGSGAYLYLGRIGTNVRIGPSDGFMGGELNQVGANVPYVDGGPNLLNFSMTIYNGEITVTYEGSDYVDTYGEIEDADVYDAYPGNEFDSRAYVGLDSYPAENEIVYDIDISGCPCGPIGKASFGFVSKYNKKTEVAEGNTEFVFKAADLNFHSTSYDWLLVTGSNYAKFKGIGTINGEGSYKFQLWAGDGTGSDGADTFRIKIWEEDGAGSENVIYDNGMDQAIGGGSIVVHTSKK